MGTRAGAISCSPSARAQELVVEHYVPVFWRLGVIISSFPAGGRVVAWGFYYKSGTPRNERAKTAADALICSSLLMTLLNVVAIHLSPIIGLALLCLFILIITINSGLMYQVINPASAHQAIHQREYG